MKKPLISLLMAAAIALPGVAQAHTTQREIRHDRHMVHKEQRELARARAHHNWHKARHERHELAKARQKLRHDRHDRQHFDQR